MPVKPVPAGYHNIIPYLMVDEGARLLEFVTKAFSAKLRGQHLRPDGSIMHAELEIGDSVVMMGEPMGEFGPMPASIFLYVDDCDAVYAKALAAGGDSVMEVTTMQFAGERYGGVKDPSGNLWWIGSHVEDVSWEEQARRIAALADQGLGE